MSTLDKYGEVIVTVPTGQILAVSSVGDNESDVFKSTSPSNQPERFTTETDVRNDVKFFGPYDHEVKFKITANQNVVNYTVSPYGIVLHNGTYTAQTYAGMVAMQTAGTLPDGTYRAKDTGRYYTVNFGIIKPVNFIDARDKGASPAIADNYAILQSLLISLAGTNTYIQLLDGKYAITQALLVPSGTGFISDGSGTIYAPSTSFNNINPLTRYTSNSCVLNLSGQTVSPFTPNTDQKILGIKVEYQFLEGRVCDGIVARNCNKLEISENELFNFPLSAAIVLDSIGTNSKVIDNYVHDISNNTVFGGGITAGQVNLWGICVDNNRINSVSSFGIHISNNWCENINHGATATAAYGNQADGINVQAGSNHMVTDNVIINTNESIDFFASDSTVTGNKCFNISGWGIKLIHGASGNSVLHNHITNVGLGGIVLVGGVAGRGNTERNVVKHNHITNVDPDGTLSPANTTGCIQVDSQGFGPIATNNDIDENILDPGIHGKYNIVTVKPTIDIANNFRRNRIVRDAATTNYSVNPLNNYIEQGIKTEVRAYLSAGQTILAAASGTWVRVMFNTETIDTNSEYDSVTNHIWTCKTPGTYRVTARAHMVSATGFKIAMFKSGGAAFAQFDCDAAAADKSISVEDKLSFVTGDYVEVGVFQNSGADRIITGGQQYTCLTITQE